MANCIVCGNRAAEGSTRCWDCWNKYVESNFAPDHVAFGPLVPPAHGLEDEWRAALGIEDTQELPAVDADGKVR